MRQVLVIGSMNYDETYLVNIIPKAGETVIANEVSFACGGKGANQAYASALTGVKTLFVGSRGNDEEGRIIEEKLNSVGVVTNEVLTLDANTGKAIIVVDNSGENSIIVHPGANFDMKYSSKIDDVIKKSSVVLVQNEIQIEEVEKFILKAIELNKIVIYNPAPYEEISLSSLKGLDYIIPNEHELIHMVPNKNSLRERVDFLLNLGIKNVIVTLGSKGAGLFDSKGNEIYIKSPNVNVQNTVGAGDCLCGTFAALINEVDVKEALKYAVYAASLSTETDGAMDSMRNIDYVREYIKEKNK